MILYVFTDASTGERLHTVKVDGSLDIYEGSYMWIDAVLYTIAKKSVFHVFKENNLNVYFVELTQMSRGENDEEKHFEYVKKSIHDLIRDSVIGNILDD